MRIFMTALLLACGPAMAGVEVEVPQPPIFDARTDIVIARSLAECAGFWGAYADVAQKKNISDWQVLADGSMEAVMASSFLAASTYQDANIWTSKISESTYAYWLDAMNNFALSTDDLTAKIEECKSLAEIQQGISDHMRGNAPGIIEELRRKAFGTQ